MTMTCKISKENSGDLSDIDQVGDGGWTIACSLDGQGGSSTNARRALLAIAWGPSPSAASAAATVTAVHRSLNGSLASILANNESSSSGAAAALSGAQPKMSAVLVSEYTPRSGLWSTDLLYGATDGSVTIWTLNRKKSLVGIDADERHFMSPYDEPNFQIIPNIECCYA
mmetsp:Transcript_14456/g.21268  ORF Transcript_14456/g.21268 Transcript_14456/m.21268 type:complete len:170 (-) Transcript_14456:2-511(-)